MADSSATGARLVGSFGELPLEQRTYALGRHEENDVSFPGSNVSRVHAHLYFLSGRFQLIDAKSRNGTYVNGQRALKPVILSDGDVIRIGDHEMRFFQEECPSSGLRASPGSCSLSEATMSSFKVETLWMVLLDIVGSTSLAQAISDEVFARKVSDLTEDGDRVVTRWQGLINKTTGDGFLAVWPGGLSESVAGAIRDLQRMQERGHPRFRVVIHRGAATVSVDPTTGHEQLSGAEVHRLFRLEKLAGKYGMTLVATKAAQVQLEPFFRVKNLGPHSLEGFSELEEVYELSWGE